MCENILLNRNGMKAECFDAQLPYEEDCSRLKRSILQDLGEWDYENDCPKP